MFDKQYLNNSRLFYLCSRCKAIAKHELAVTPKVKSFQVKQLNEACLFKIQVIL